MSCNCGGNDDRGGGGGHHALHGVENDDGGEDGDCVARSKNGLIETCELLALFLPPQS